MISFRCRTIAGATFLLMTSALAQDAQPQIELEWEVVHRFRTIADETGSGHFLKRMFPKDGVTKLNLSSVLGYSREQLRRYIRTAWSQERAQYESDWFHNTRRTISVQISRAGLIEAGVAPADIGKIECSYQVAGQAEAHKGLCRKSTRLPVQTGASEIDVSIGGMPPRRAKVDVKEMKIAIIGDSFASGEGNPHHYQQPKPDNGDQTANGWPALWLDERCNRSLVSGPMLSAARLALDHKDTSVTAVSFACSGAEIIGGILESYAGIRTFDEVNGDYSEQNAGAPAILKGPVPAQISQLNRLLCVPDTNCNNRARIDVLVVSIGGNDIGFGEWVKSALRGNATVELRAKRAEIAQRFERLTGRYARLGKMIGDLSPVQTLLMSYLDPTKQGLPRNRFAWCTSEHWKPITLDGQILTSKFGPVHLTKDESSEIFVRILKRLQDNQQVAARTFGWTIVDGFSNRNGVCGAAPYFHSYFEAQQLQGCKGPDTAGTCIPSGAIHPNMFGHLHMVSRILPRFEEARAALR